MTSLLERLMDLWASPPDDRDDPVADFREVYFDPVTVNGDPFAVADLVARAGAVHRSYADLRMEVVHRLETPDRIVIGFWMRGRHVGPLSTPLGVVAPTGRVVANRVTDILTVRDDRVTDIWVISDDLALLRQLDAVSLVQESADPTQQA